jgi:ribokinase
MEARNRVAVVGSANMDLVLRTPRFPNPGQTVLASDFRTFPGGKGANQVVAAARLGANASFIGKLGEDAFGDDLLESMQGAGVDVSHVLRDPSAPTGVAAIFVNERGQNMIAVASGANMNLSVMEVSKALDRMPTPKVLLAQLEVHVDTVAEALRTVPETTIRILNPAPARTLADDLLAEVDVLTPNESEARALTGIDPVDDATCLEAARRLLDRGVGAVIITLGSSGCFCASDNSSARLPAPLVQAVDTTGAGDAFNGALAYFLAQDRELEEAAALANCVGAVSTTRSGAQASMPTLEEIREIGAGLF